MQNKDLSVVEIDDLLDNSGNAYHHEETHCSDPIRYHLGNNVIDVGDIDLVIESNSVRSISFGTDYSLTRGIPNSFVSALDLRAINGTAGGRLTLNSIKFFGKARESLIPKTTFEYSENPDYDEDAFDIWGFYKSDIDPDLCELNESVGRAVSSESSTNTDAWSLTKINSPLGGAIEVEYESDEYQVPDEYKSYSVSVTGAEIVEGTTSRVRLTFDEGFIPSQHYQINDEIDFISLDKTRIQVFDYARLSALPPDANVISNLSCNNFNENNDDIVKISVTDTEPLSVTQVETTVKTVNSSYLEIDDIVLFAKLKESLTSLCEVPSPILSPDSNPDDYVCDYFGSHPNESFCSVEIRTAQHITGNITLAGSNSDILGGGLRVAKISVKDQFKENSTTYEYEDDDGHTSGITSYEPVKIEKIRLGSDEVDLANLSDESDPRVIEYVGLVYGERQVRILAHSRDIPGPGVFYGKVTVKQQSRDLSSGLSYELPQYSQYEFETFNPLFYTIRDFDSNSNNNFSPNDGSAEGISYTASYYDNVTIKDMTSRIGLLKKVSTYNTNGTLLSETINEYLHDDDQLVSPLTGDEVERDEHINDFRGYMVNNHSGQGLIDETFANARLIRKDENDNLGGSSIGVGEYYVLAVKSKREFYPTIQLGTRTVNYTTGVESVNRNLEYDFYSGQATRTQYFDSYGNSYVKETTPAYRKYPLMGPGVRGGKNMLIQEAETKTFKTVSSENLNPEFLVSANIQTWSDEIDTNIPDPVTGSGLISNYTDGLGRIAGYKISASGDIQDRSFSTTIEEQEYFYKVGSPIGTEFSIFFFGGEPDANGLVTYNVNFREFVPQGIFKKHRSFYWKGDDRSLEQNGLYPVGQFREFNAWNKEQIPSSDQWQQTSEITKYDVYSHALEAKDINGDYAATKFDNDNKHVYATVANAHYNEFAYSGAEDFINDPEEFGGDIQRGVGAILSEEFGFAPHTGTYVMGLTPDSKGFIFQTTIEEAKIFRISAWTNDVNGKVFYKIDNGSDQYISVDETKKSGDWYLISGNVTIPANATVESGVTMLEGTIALFDDFRFHPVDAAMTSYVYNEWGELSHILDQNNLYTRFEYDEIGRLKATFKETFQYGEVEVSRNDYHYKGSEELDNFLTGTINTSSVNDVFTVSDVISFSVPLNREHLDGYGYNWNFGDGSTSSSPNPNKSYPINDSYLVKVKVTENSTGLSFETKIEVSVLPDCPDEGELLSHVCEYDDEGCLTGRIRDRMHDGQCGFFDGDWYTPSEPELLILCHVDDTCPANDLEPDF
ncbi:MAG: PKD domain-containing protein [Bacteroidota bacterium]